MPGRMAVGFTTIQGAGTHRNRTPVLRRPQLGGRRRHLRRLRDDAEATRYLSWPRHLSVEQTRAFLEFSDDHWAPLAGRALRDRIDKADDRLVGATGLAFESPWCASTGYVLAPRVLGTWVCRPKPWRRWSTWPPRAGVIRLYALCHTDHAASRRVLEKGGFECEGLLRRQTVFPNLGRTVRRLDVRADPLTPRSGWPTPALLDREAFLRQHRAASGDAHLDPPVAGAPGVDGLPAEGAEAGAAVGPHPQGHGLDHVVAVVPAMLDRAWPAGPRPA